MDRISAANNLTIEYDQTNWRLVSNGAGVEHILVEAESGRPLSYMPTFGSRRRLPDTGKLPTQYIQQVVLGWSPKDQAWHLGLLLEQELADARGSRWCEIAHWHDPQRDHFVELASQAGERLAETVTRPFHVIPPREDDLPAPSAPTFETSAAPLPAEATVETSSLAATVPIAAQETHPAASTQPNALNIPLPTPATYPPYQDTYQAQREPAPIPELPLTLDLWNLDQPQGFNYLQLKLSGAWGRSKVARILWYTLWTVVYIVLSVTTLRSGIAQPRPEFLPYLGLASGGILVLLILYLLFQLIRTPNRFIIDPSRQAVIALRGKAQRWRIEAHQMKAVYVSQIVSRRSRKQRRAIHYSEINLLLSDEKFHHLIENGQVEDKDTRFEDSPAENEVRLLTPDAVDSSMKAAGYYIARTLNVPCYYDQRLK
jgi:hypothetical protein